MTDAGWAEKKVCASINEVIKMSKEQGRIEGIFDAARELHDIAKAIRKKAVSVHDAVEMVCRRAFAVEAQGAQRKQQANECNALTLAADVLRKEHARAVKVVDATGEKFIVQAAKCKQEYGQYVMGYNDAINDILTALQRGRGGKG